MDVNNLPRVVAAQLGLYPLKLACKPSWPDR